jgi:hypothetical protein
MSVPAAIAVINSRPVTPPRFSGQRKGNRYCRNADVAPAPDIVVVEHMTEAAIRENRLCDAAPPKPRMRDSAAPPSART